MAFHSFHKVFLQTKPYPALFRIFAWKTPSATPMGKYVGKVRITRRKPHVSWLLPATACRAGVLRAPHMQSTLPGPILPGFRRNRGKLAVDRRVESLFSTSSGDNKENALPAPADRLRGLTRADACVSCMQAACGASLPCQSPPRPAIAHPKNILHPPNGPRPSCRRAAITPRNTLTIHQKRMSAGMASLAPRLRQREASCPTAPACACAGMKISPCLLTCGMVAV